MYTKIDNNLPYAYAQRASYGGVLSVTFIILENGICVTISSFITKQKTPPK